jgi:NADH:ubiquinone oxidoreductase subunit K
LYSLFLVLGVYVDDINLISFSFFILAFAAAEFSLGYILLLNFKTVKESYFLKKNKKNINLRSSSDLLSSINSFF